MPQPASMPPTPVIGPDQPLRVALVGCGQIAESAHLPALMGLRGQVQVIGAADPCPHRRRRIAGMFGLPRTAGSLPELLHRHGTEFDAVAICSPATSHADAVLAALAAGKHVLIEKPLALTLDDADRIVAAAEAHPQQKVMLGFNLRHHRLVRQARALIESGKLGPVELVRTLWISGQRFVRDIPAWRNRRTTGGGVLAEIFVHHVDLLRYLIGAEVETVTATADHGVGDDETAVLTLQLSNRATATCIFSERGADANEIELLGRDGRLSFSLYRFDSLTFTPRTGGRGRLAQIRQTIRDLPAVWPILRRGGDFRETYRQQWLAFLNCIRLDTPVPASVQDGREALRTVLAAGASANAHAPVALASAPRQPVAAQREVEVDAAMSAEDTDGSACEAEPLTSSPLGREEPERQPAQPRGMADPAAASTQDPPALSAIIATRSTFESIRRTIRCLRAQTIRDQIELLIICPSAAELALDTSAVSGFHSHRVIEVGPIHSIARANAAGVRAATAPVIVLCEDHAFPEPDWAEALVIAHRGPYAAVGPVVHNANPATMVSWADCLIGYGPWLEPIRACEPHHLPGHNSSYKRDILLAYGQRLDEMMEAETVLQWDLRAHGHRLYLDPHARLAHTNFALLGIWTRVQFHAGRMFGATRALGWPIWKRAFYAAASPLIPLVRFKRIWGQARRISAAHRLLPRVLPALAWGLLLDGLGQMAGYATGAGRSRAKIAQYEFDRIRYITEQDRQALSAVAHDNPHDAAQCKAVQRPAA